MRPGSFQPLKTVTLILNYMVHLFLPKVFVTNTASFSFIYLFIF